ncbi:hypothetical protein ACFL00_02110 [Pseudomonadota bacterium]
MQRIKVPFNSFTALPSDCFEFSYQPNGYPFNLTLHTTASAKKCVELMEDGIYAIFDKINNCTLSIELVEDPRAPVVELLREELEALTLRGANVTFGQWEPDLDGLFRSWDDRIDLTEVSPICSEELRQAICEDIANGDVNNRLCGMDADANGGHRKFADDNWDQFASWSNAAEAAAGMDQQFFLVFCPLYRHLPSDLPSEIQRSENQEKYLLNLLKREFNPLADEEHIFGKRITSFSKKDAPYSGPIQLLYTIREISKRNDEFLDMKMKKYTKEMDKIIHRWRSFSRIPQNEKSVA